MQTKVERFEDIGFVCDVCMAPVFLKDCNMQASLSAKFGYGSEEDGNEYHLDLCQNCFKAALAEMRVIRRSEFMFDEEIDDHVRCPDNFGLIRKYGKEYAKRVKIVEGRKIISGQEGS